MGNSSMKLAFVTDTHFGFRRFEADAIRQGREAILAAAREADVLILGGDNFDTPLPRMETIAEVTGILREALGIFHSRGIAGVPIYAIHGNHDRRARGFVHPTELLAHGGFLVNAHNKTIMREINGETVAISGMGNVPDDLAAEGLKKIECRLVSGAFNVFVLHQTFKESSYGREEYLSYDDLPEGYDLYLCGHIHKPNLSSKVMNPGSTVATTLHEDEYGQRGWLLYDTVARKGEFKPINSRQFFFSAINFENATPDEVKRKLEEEAKRLLASAKPDARSPLVRVVAKGTLAPGFGTADLRMPHLGENIFIDSNLNADSLKGKIAQIKISREKKLTSRQQGMEILRKKLEGTGYSLGDAEDVFESLIEGRFLAEIKEKIEKEKAS